MTDISALEYVSLDDKILGLFGPVAFRKGVGGDIGLRDGRNVPTYVEEWLIGRFANKDGIIDESGKTKLFMFIRNHLPGKGEKELLKSRLLSGEVLTILDAYDASVDLRSGERRVRVRSIDIDDALIEPHLVDEYPQLYTGNMWGAGKLTLDVYRDKNRVRLVDFTPMQAGKVDLQGYKDKREQFCFDEWRSLLLRTIGYDASYYSEEQQSVLLMRLLPLVQPRLNIMELAPKGTGKSFVYMNLSRYTWVVSGGTITAAALFYNNSSKLPGLFTRYDVVVLDEGQSIQFDKPKEMAGLLKGYLEAGEYTRGNNKVTADAGLVVLANILTQDDRPTATDYVRSLPVMFHESAVLDRFHGIVPGWLVPRFTTEATAHGVGLKADYIAEVFRQLRGDVQHMDFVRQHVLTAGDRRDLTAIERLCAGFLKLYFPDLCVTAEEFADHCLAPAIDLRQRIRDQLAEVDPGSFANKAIARAEVNPRAFA